MPTIKKYRLLLLSLALIGQGTQYTLAQQGTDVVKPVLKRMQSAYHQAAYLSFDVTYLYANESRADQPTDTLKGAFQMDKDRCRMVVDGTETLITPQHVIRVEPENRLIYLGRAGHGVDDPESLIDSLISRTKGNIRLEETTGDEVLTIDFPPGEQYKRIEIVIDRQTAYLRQVTYFLKTEGLVGNALVRSPGHDAPYEADGRVLMKFSGYRQRAFGETAFDETNFISHADGKYQPAGQYKGYKLILASENL